MEIQSAVKHLPLISPGDVTDVECRPQSPPSSASPPHNRFTRHLFDRKLFSIPKILQRELRSIPSDDVPSGHPRQTHENNQTLKWIQYLSHASRNVEYISNHSLSPPPSLRMTSRYIKGNVMDLLNIQIWRGGDGCALFGAPPTLPRRQNQCPSVFHGVESVEATPSLHLNRTK